MSCIALIYAGVFSVLLTSCATDDRGVASKGSTQTIPLADIWASEMPGTRDVRELEPDSFGEKTRALPSDKRAGLLTQSLTEQILRTFKYPGPKDPDARKGFAVLGTGLEALRGAHRVLVAKDKPDQSFPEGSQISVVFFSNKSGSEVHLVNAERTNDTINVQYRFVSHLSDDLMSHFAIIPLGKLPVGKYQVEMIQLPRDQIGIKTRSYVPTSELRRIICQPFSFSVVRRN